eukprot:scaffold58517_cov36-Phaeocystis_antarctica.AAC.1
MSCCACARSRATTSNSAHRPASASSRCCPCRTCRLCVRAARQGASRPRLPQPRRRPRSQKPHPLPRARVPQVSNAALLTLPRIPTDEYLRVGQCLLLRCRVAQPRSNTERPSYFTNRAALHS